MNFLEYIKTLMPVFSKNDITVSCELTKSSIREHTLPAYKTASILWQGQKFKSEEIKDFVNYYDRTVGTSRSENMVTSIEGALENSLILLDALTDESKSVYSNHEANVSLTYLKTSIIRLIEATSFANIYSRRLLNYIYICETNANFNSKDKEAEGTVETLTPAELKWLTSGLQDFCQCITVMKYNVTKITKSLNELPDANITELTEKSFHTTIGTNKIDPFSMRHFSARINPFYLFGMWKAERQANAYKAAKAELELLQLRKLNLQKVLDKKPDAKLEKEIDYMQNRVSGLIYDLDKMEQHYGD
jgi:hypothetical protein